MGIGAGLLIAPKVGTWNKYLTRKTKQGQDLIGRSIKRTEAKVSDVAGNIIETLEKGRKAVAT
jgi:gas vesicle protein